MKKTILILLLVIIVPAMVMAQNGKISIHQIDSLTGEQFSQIVKKQFNAVINSSGKTTIGNYASADIKDGHLAFNATRNFKNGNMLSLNANGGITDGFFAVFNETKINSNIGVDFKYNMMLNKASSLSFYTSEIDKLKKRIKNADSEYKVNVSIHQHDSILLKKKLLLVEAEIKDLLSRQDLISLSLKERANVEYQIALRNLQTDSLNLKLQTLKSAAESDEDFKKKKKKDKSVAVDEFEYTAIRFKWFSLGAGFQNNNFNLFKPEAAVLDSQLVKQNYTTWNITAEYNLYKWNHYARYTYYFLLGGKFTIDDNFSDLSKTELSDTYQYGDTVVQRTSGKKITAYAGDYQTKLPGTKFYFDYYKFFLGNAAAIHIYPEAIFKKHSYPMYNAGIGLLYSFNDATDDENKAKLNAELYFKLSDLANNMDSDLSLLQRNELGLRLSIPVSFFNF